MYFCTVCIWRHQQLLTALVFNNLMLAKWQTQAELNVDLTWALVLAPDGKESATIERLMMLRPQLQATQIRMLVAFADMTPTDGYYHKSWACSARSPYKGTLMDPFKRTPVDPFNAPSPPLGASGVVISRAIE